MLMDPRYLAQLFPTKSREEIEHDEIVFKKFEELTSQLPMGLEGTKHPMRLYQGHWRLEVFVPSTMALQSHFKPRHGDIFVTSYPKCGTTWIKSLVFSIVTRRDHSTQHPLLTHNPHGCVYSMEDMYMTRRMPDWEIIPSPRLLSTHASYSELPMSMRNNVKSTEYRMVYVCREPKDNFTALWHAQRRLIPEGAPMMLPLNASVDAYCRGMFGWGSIWEHMIDYWDAHKKNPGKVLFLKFEDLKKDVRGVTRRIAEFVGDPFSEEEEKEGTVEEIVQLCSIENMTKLDVNRFGKIGMSFEVQNKTFFRLGTVGDWVNLLTPEMAASIDAITDTKLAGSGLSFTP